MQITGELIGLFVLLAGAISTLLWRYEGKLASEAKERERVQNDLYEFKLYVAQNYVSGMALRETEQRLINAVERLSVRMEAVVARLDKMTIKQNKDSEQ